VTVLPFAWRSLVRQPARSTLGIAGVAAVGALLFDMLLLSEGLVLSMRELFERLGFDIRIIATDQLPGGSPDILEASSLASKLAALPSVQSVLMQTDHELVLNQYAARTLHAEPGTTVTVRATCARGAEAPPSIAFRVVGIAELPFETPDEPAAGTTAASLSDACGTPQADLADFLAVTSTGDPDAAAAAIAAINPGLRIFTNEQAIGQLQQGGFTYFRQISTVLTTITVSFALLLITVLLTVSVNQRLGEVAALRALGFSRSARRALRVDADRGHGRSVVASSRGSSRRMAGRHPQEHAGHSGSAALFRLRPERPGDSRGTSRRHRDCGRLVPDVHRRPAPDRGLAT
jgi:hypothetical protein